MMGLTDPVASASRPSEEATLELSFTPARGPWRLELGTPQGTHEIVLEAGERVTLGSRRPADVRLRDRAVSAVHARVSAREEHVEVEDLGSRNGVYVGLARVGSARLSAAGACFVIGRSSITLQPHRPHSVLDDVRAVPGMVGESSAMRRVYDEIHRHAARRAPVLIQGESGTGKDLVARALHLLSRRTGAYVPINAGAVAESLADSELFGHQRGAFTGAVASRQGALEAADGGTLFLDEVAELGAALQVKLLRVVEDGVVRPVGSATGRRVDVRLVSASWADLRTQVTLGRFRPDLFHRISTVTIEVPPLRARRSDIAELSGALLGRLRDELGPKRLDSEALAVLLAHDWPGNVRELASVLYRAASAAEGPAIGAYETARAIGPIGPSALDQDQARQLLEVHDGNQTLAARAVGVPRSTFRGWLERPRRPRSVSR